jgi:hypothetical protein
MSAQLRKWNVPFVWHPLSRPIQTPIIHVALPWADWPVFSLTHKRTPHNWYRSGHSQTVKGRWRHLKMNLYTAVPWLLALECIILCKKKQEKHNNIRVSAYSSPIILVSTTRWQKQYILSKYHSSIYLKIWNIPLWHSLPQTANNLLYCGRFPSPRHTTYVHASEI